jgi:hypothetical protein
MPELSTQSDQAQDVQTVSNHRDEEKMVFEITELENDDLVRVIDKAMEHGDMVQMRSSMDDVPIFTAVRLYWRVSLVCMAAAFTASLDGYREHTSGDPIRSRDPNNGDRNCLGQLDRL